MAQNDYMDHWDKFHCSQSATSIYFFSTNNSVFLCVFLFAWNCLGSPGAAGEALGCEASAGAGHASWNTREHVHAKWDGAMVPICPIVILS